MLKKKLIMVLMLFVCLSCGNSESEFNGVSDEVENTTIIADNKKALHKVDPKYNQEVHQWIALQAGKIFPNDEINERLSDSDYNAEIDQFGYSNGKDILIGAGEEDRDTSGTKGGDGTHPGDFKNIPDYFGDDGPWCFHFWNPDSSQDGDYNDGLTFSYVDYLSNYQRSQYIWDNYIISNYESDRSKSYYYLGRVAHLITDMCVPAHVHNDPHPISDAFEDFMVEKGAYEDRSDDPNFLHFTGSELKDQQYDFESIFFPEGVKANPTDLFKLYWYVSQKTQYFASNNKSGNYFYRNENGNGGIFKESLWGNTDIVSDNSVVDSDHPENLKKIADALVPHAMKAVAGLYRLFWHKTHVRYEVSTTPVSGEIYLDGSLVGTGSWSDFVEAGTHTITFGDVAGYRNPGSYTFTLSMGNTETLVGKYIGNSVSLPDLMPSTPNGWSSPLVIRSDLGCMWDNCSQKNIFEEKDTLYVSISVHNKCLSNVSNQFVTTVYVDGLQKKSLTIPSLKAGSSYLSWNYSIGSLSPGQHKIEMDIDTSNNINESDEGNNKYSYNFTVTPTPVKVLSHIEITGASEVTEQTSSYYTCRAYYNDGSSTDVTDDVTWSVNPDYGIFGGSPEGLLWFKSITNEQTITITASYEELTDTHEILVKPFNNELKGSGVDSDPYLITSLPEFDLFANNPKYWSGPAFMTYVRLETDIDLSGRIYTTAVIGKDISIESDFQGTDFSTCEFDGNNHKIKNLTIDTGGADNCYLGLFGMIDNADIKNLTLENCNITSGPGSERIGALVGSNSGRVKNCQVSGTITGGNSLLGGLVGYSWYGYINRCGSTVNVVGGSNSFYIGGLVGRNRSGTGYGYIGNSYARGNVKGSDHVGGLVGRNNREITNCYSTGQITGETFYGGLIGSNSDGYGTINNSFWDINTSGINYSEGGIGKTTSQMLDMNTYLDANWDFFDETKNGIQDIWVIRPNNYPEFVLQPIPSQIPFPENGAIDQPINIDLSWSKSDRATNYNIYFGTDPTPDNNEFKGEQSETTYDPGILAYNTTYYWRIDAINSGGTTTNDVWSFKTEITVPDIVGLSQKNAESDIISAKLTVGTIISDYSETVPAGNVISQNPSAETPVATGSTVNLVISVGRRILAVPDIVGLSQKNAESDIISAELTVGTIINVNSTNVPAGSVISQNPVSGSLIIIGSPVDMVISIGTLIDQCSNDLNKTEPGICGCGVPDTDSDLDGIPDCNDECPNEFNNECFGDDNHPDNDDIIPDTTNDNITTIQANGGQINITFESSPGTTLSNCQTINNPSSTDTPINIDFPFGLFKFTIGEIESNGSATIAIILPSGANPTTYYKYGPTLDNQIDHWYEFLYDGETGAKINGNKITLYFVDGKRGDSDLDDTNGIVVDPGGPGVNSGNVNNMEDTTNTEETPTATENDGGGGGGCFLSSSTN